MLEITRISDGVEAESFQNTVTIRVAQYFPDHGPRADDPHYNVFTQARRAMEKAGTLKCFICGVTDTPEAPIELHHRFVEWSLQSGVDLEKFKITYPDSNVETYDDLAIWVNSAFNLLPLCKYHHVGAGGIHCLPEPLFFIQKYWRTDLPPAGRKLSKLGEIAFINTEPNSTE